LSWYLVSWSISKIVTHKPSITLFPIGDEA
jgi:hypothetical protein